MARDATSLRLEFMVAAALLLVPVLAAGQEMAGQDSLAVPAMVGADSLAAAAPDSSQVVPALEPVPDFFDTGINGTAAVMMTPVMPGWGQLYADNGWRAMVSFGAQWYFWSKMFAADRQARRFRDHGQLYPEGDPGRTDMDRLANEYWEVMRDYAWWSGAVLLIVALDAYVGAGLYKFDEEPIPVPNRFDEYFDTGVPEPPGSRGAPLLVVWQWGKKF